MNFKKETMNLIEELGVSVVAYKFLNLKDWSDAQVFKGEREINWKEIPGKLLHYCNDFGTQYWRGIILLSDGSWLTRDEYDGSEWWEHHKLPTVEEVLNTDL